MALHIDTSEMGLLPRHATVSTDTESTRSLGSRAKPDATAPRGHIVAAEDGTPLLLRRWLPDKPARAQLLMVHDYLDYGERFSAMAQALVPRRIGCHAIDLRGHGVSSGPRGHVRTLTDYSDDIQASLNALPPGPQFLLGVGHSGLCVMDFVAQRRPQLQGLIAVEPAITIRALHRPKWQHTLMRALGGIWPRVRVPKALWYDVGYEAAPLVRAPMQPALLAPLQPKHMSGAWWRDVPRIQQRVSKVAQLNVPLLYIDDGEATDLAAGPLVPPLLAGPKQRVRCVRVADAGARVRAGEADTALVDAVAHFIRRRLPRRPAAVSHPPTTGQSQLSPAPSLPAVPELNPCSMTWCSGLAEWPAIQPLAMRTSMPGTFPT